MAGLDEGLCDPSRVKGEKNVLLTGHILSCACGRRDRHERPVWPLIGGCLASATASAVSPLAKMTISTGDGVFKLAQMPCEA